MNRAQSFDSFAADYDRFASLEQPRFLDWALSRLPEHGRYALDAGCGSGRLTVVLAERFDRILAVDISQPLIEIARSTRSRPNIDYRVQDLMAVDGASAFDFVFSSTTLHHLPDLRAALIHLRQLLRPGGVMVLIDNVAPWTTPPRIVHLVGAVRRSPTDLVRFGWARSRWLFSFRTSRAWLDHLASDRYLSRPAFRRTYSSVFSDAQFRDFGYAQGMAWVAR